MSDYTTQLNKMLADFRVRVNAGGWAPFKDDILQRIDEMSPVEVDDPAEPMLILMGKMVLWLEAGRPHDSDRS